MRRNQYPINQINQTNQKTVLPPGMLFGPDNRPLTSRDFPSSCFTSASASAAGIAPYRNYDVSRIAGGIHGSLSNWLVSRNDNWLAKQERETIADRAEDLASNDTHAASVIDSMSINISGAGITPQSRPNAKILNWNDDETKNFQDQAEWAFHIWQKKADITGRMHFWQICLLAVRTMLVRGEFFKIPVMLKNRSDMPQRTFSLALQSVDPLRIYTPSDLTHKKNIKDGVEFNKFGVPQAYYIANPTDGFITRDLPLSKCVRVPATTAGYRSGAFHVFMPKSEEQLRGVSILAPAMKFFKDLNDYLDFELVGAIIAASFPVFIESPDPMGVASSFDAIDPVNPTTTKNKYQETEPGQILYGNPGEKPHILKSERPGNSFDSFVERILRGIGASIGLPYEIIAKDFSKTNYSSARAALLEAWRLFFVYQKWLIDSFCQPVWEMVLEEAWLRDMIKLPAGSPDWYDAKDAYTRAHWIPPKKGSIDLKKEVDAYVAAKDNNIMPLANIHAEIGQGDWEQVLEQIAKEKQKEKDLNISSASPIVPAIKSENSLNNGAGA